MIAPLLAKRVGIEVQFSQSSRSSPQRAKEAAYSMDGEDKANLPPQAWHSIVHSDSKENADRRRDVDRRQEIMQNPRSSAAKFRYAVKGTEVQVPKVL